MRKRIEPTPPPRGTFGLLPWYYRRERTTPVPQGNALKLARDWVASSFPITLHSNTPPTQLAIAALTTAIRREQIVTPNGSRDRAYPPSVALSEEAFIPFPGPAYLPYLREKPALPLKSGIPFFQEFLRRYLHLPTATSYLDRKTLPLFYVFGPTEKLPLNLLYTSDEPRLAAAAFPHIGIPEGDIQFIAPTPDNLVWLHFRILDARGEQRCGYAFDNEEATLFSRYQYEVEEERQFRILNQAHLTEEEQDEQKRGLDQIRNYCRTFLEHKKFPPSIPRIQFKIAGPLRALHLNVDGKIAIFPYLHLQPNEVFVVKSVPLSSRDKTRKRMVITFTPEGGSTFSHVCYFSPTLSKRERDVYLFLQPIPASVNQKGRVTVPPRLRPKPWDGEPKGFVL